MSLRRYNEVLFLLAIILLLLVGFLGPKFWKIPQPVFNFKSIQNFKKLNYDINFVTNFGRDVEYYTGIVFEVFSGKKEIASGGRYDDLLKSLGAKKKIPAVGAAINLKNI